MITVIIGGGKHEELRASESISALGQVTVLRASHKGSFMEFCKRAVRSTNTLRIREGLSEKYTDVIANDDIIVFFSEEYMKKAEVPVIYKIATVLETGIDLGLDVQVLSLTSPIIWNPNKLVWPMHWPVITLIK